MLRSVLRYWSSLPTAVKTLVEVIVGVCAILGFAVTVWNTLIYNDKGSDFENEYVTKYEDIITRLDTELIENNIDKIRSFDNREQYNKYIVELIQNNKDVGSKIRAIAAFFERILTCDASLTCGYDGRDYFYDEIRAFWFKYGAYLESIRGSIVATDYAKSIENKTLNLK